MGVVQDYRLGGREIEIIVQSTIPPERLIENVESCFRLNLPRFVDLPGLGKRTGPVAIVGGGPSLAREIGNLRKFPGPIIGCGSVHDYLVENDCNPTYHVTVDPEAIICRWFIAAQKDITYLLASQCHPSLFEHLKNHNVRVWHALVVYADEKTPTPNFRKEPVIPGGDFVIGRAWPIAAIMGHRDFHFYGFDCSFPKDCDSQHAYRYDWQREEPVIAVCEHTGERFVTTPGWMNQLNTFAKLLAMSGGQFKITIHGESLAASMCAKPRSPK